MDARRDTDDENDDAELPAEVEDDEWRDARSPADTAPAHEEWRRGIQPPRDDEWAARSDAQRRASGGLTDADTHALHDITGIGHQELNRALSQGTIEDVEHVAPRVTAVTRALDHLEPHEGTVLRGSFGDLTEAQIAEYVPGDIRVEDRFLHSSVDPEVADGWFHGNVVWVIDSKNGREVGGNSAVGPSEKEVMFDKFARFEVLAKDRLDETGQWLIYMREL